MGLFYIVTEESNEMFEMSVTESVSVTGSTRISDSKTEDKTVVSDNAVAYNQIISYNGMVTSIESIGANPRALSSPEEYIESLEKVRTDRKFVTCWIDSALNPISDCLIEKLDFTKTMEEGITSWKVSLVCKKIRVVEEASSTTVPKPASKDTTSQKADAGNATTKQESDQQAFSTGGLNVLQQANPLLN